MIPRKIILFLVNTMFCGTRFFKVKCFLLRLAGIDIGDNVRIVGPIFFSKLALFKIDDNVWIGRNFVIEGNGSCIIEKNCDIGPNVTIGTGGHRIGGATRRAGFGVSTECRINAGTWVGQNCLIINNSIIGAGSVVAAGSCVIKDVPENCLVAGVPATVKKKLPI